MNGERMQREMAEQPTRLRALIARAEEIAETVRTAAHPPLHGVTIVARGSSDHAATYGRYLLEGASGRPVSLAAPSLQTLYRLRVDYHGQLVVAVSQSGRTPEIVDTLRALSAAGAGSLAITNDPTSDLAGSAGSVIGLGAGEEVAVPATKTVTAQMAAFAILAWALGPVPFSLEELRMVPDWVERVLADGEPAHIAAERLTDAPHVIVVARGYLYGAALEIALKVKETCALLADGYSSADLRHGPIAAVTAGLPVVALSARGPALEDIEELLDALRRRGACLVTIGQTAGADLGLPDAPEALVPILAVVRGQQLAHALALRLGLDPDRPPGLRKITVT